MRQLSWLAIAVTLALPGCQPEVPQGLVLYPPFPDPMRQSPRLGFASDGTLWVVSVNLDGDAMQLRPWRFASGHWELGTPLESKAEGGGEWYPEMWLLGMQSDAPVIYAQSQVEAQRSSSNPLCPSVIPGPFQPVVARYEPGLWTSMPVCHRNVVLGPDGRFYARWSDGRASDGYDVRVSVSSPTWDTEESNAILLASAESADPLNGRFAFSPSGEPMYEHLVSLTLQAVLGFRRWDGAAWVPAAADLVVGFDGLGDPIRDFHIDSQGRIWVMPRKDPGSVRRWNGVEWENLGTFYATPSSHGSDLEGPAASAVDAEDRLVVAWVSQREPATVSMARYGAGGWEDLGSTIEDPGKVIFYLALAIAPDKTPVIAWVTNEPQWFLALFSNWPLKVARYVEK